MRIADNSAFLSMNTFRAQIFGVYEYKIVGNIHWEHVGAFGLIIIISGAGTYENCFFERY